MDKDLLRIVIIVVGGLVILGMILWGVYSGGSKRKKNIFYTTKKSLDNIDPKLVVNTEDDEFDIIPLSTRDNDDYFQVKTHSNSAYVPEAPVEESDSELDLDLELELGLQLDQEELTGSAQEDTKEEIKRPLPALLQLSILARAKEGMTGTQLLEACEQVGLVYGSVKVFERLDILGRVDYAVASMVEPGVFPGDNWETYHCPGITFFMQPREVDDAATVFAEMMNTIGKLSVLLKGDVLDQNHQLLTKETLHAIEEGLT